jgi:large subunit ribosomal protein L23
VSKESIYDIIRYPVVTEKSTLAAESNKYIFKVKVCATKSSVKNAIEKIFNVKVLKVNSLNVIGKTKRFRGILGKRSDYKKVIVSVAEGQTIDASLGV